MSQTSVNAPTEEEKSNAMVILMRIQEEDQPSETEVAAAMSVLLKSAGIPTEGLSQEEVFDTLTEVTKTNPDLIQKFFNSVIEYRQSQMLSEGGNCACCSQNKEQHSHNHGKYKQLRKRCVLLTSLNRRVKSTLSSLYREYLCMTPVNYK